MKNIIKYLGCLALGLLILNKVDFSVYAAEPSKVVRHVEYDEITDVNQLLQMGIEEYQKTPKVRNQSENEEITVKQLLSITEYDDGTIEKEYCVTGLGMVDAEEALKEMLNEDANKEYAKGELEYIQELKKRESIEG